MPSVLWSDYTTNEIAGLIQNEYPVVIVTVGATEQHGLHLPLNTDTDIGFQFARMIAEASPIKTLVLPPVWAGFSPHHMDFSGTITLRQTTLFSLVFDIVESLIHHGIRKILVLNSHGGNTALLKTVVDEIAVKHKVSPILATYWHLISDVIKEIRKSEDGGMAHACELETSLKIVFSPQDVRSGEFQDVMIPGNEFHNVDMFASNKIGFYRPFKHMTEGGQIGAPTLASNETGEMISRAVVEKFVTLFQTYWMENPQDAEETL